MLVSRRVEDVVVTVYDEDYDRVIARLANEGIFHVAEPPREVKGSIDKSLSHAFALAGEYSSRIAGFFAALGREPETVEGLVLKVSDWVETLKKVIEEHKDLHREFEGGTQRLAQIESEIQELVALKAQLEEIKHIDEDVRSASRASRISYTIGYTSAPDSVLENAAKKAGVVVAVEDLDEERRIAAFAGLYPDVRKAVEEARRYGWTPIVIPEGLPGSPSEAYKAVEERIRDLMAQADRLRNKLLARIDELKRYYTLVTALREVLRFLTNTVRTRNLRVIRGFVDVADVGRLKRILEETTGGAYTILSLGVKKRKAEGAPTKVQLPGPFKVFHNIVRLYGEPDPDEIVPTLFLAISMPVIFALMFPDAGHGLLVLLFALLYMKKRSPEWATLVAILGASSIVSGILAGEFFGPLVSKKIGLHHFWESLGFEVPPLASPAVAAEHGAEAGDLGTILFYQGVSISLWIGAFMLTLGSLLGVVDALLKGHKHEAVLVKAPKFLFFLAVTSPFLLLFDVRKAGPIIRAALLEGTVDTGIAAFFYYGIIIGLLWLFAGNIILAVQEGEGAKTGLGHAFLEVYETLLMAVGNIPSFLRIMALSLAHSSLMLGFAEISLVVAGAGGIGLVFGALVYIFGNLLAAGLEGILAYAHSLRLHFYEWFSKFYYGSGQPFTPITVPGVRIEIA